MYNSGVGRKGDYKIPSTRTQGIIFPFSPNKMKLFIVLFVVLSVANAALLSRGKPTQAGPQCCGSNSAKAVDGNRSGNFNGHKSCSHSKDYKGPHNWWRVNLGKPHHIQMVRIWNRTDCCGNRIHNAEVYAGGHLCGKVHYHAGKPFQDVNCRGKVAHQVTIKQPHNALTLCEVEVHGHPHGKK